MTEPRYTADTITDDALDELYAERDRLSARVAEYEAAIGWETTCLNCSRQTTAAYQDTMRAEQAEAAVQRVRDLFAYWTRAFPGNPAAPHIEETVTSVIDNRHVYLPGGDGKAWAGCPNYTEPT